MITTYELTELPELEGIPATKCSHDDCERKLISEAIWDKANETARKKWRRAGYYQHGARGRCGIHIERKSAEEHNEERRLEAERYARFLAGKYHGLVRQGFRDPIGEMAHQLNLTTASIQRYLHRAGVDVPRRDTREYRRDAIIEEVQFFRSLGRGMHEISDKLGLTDEELARNLRVWKRHGLVDIDLGWLVDYELEPAA